MRIPYRVVKMAASPKGMRGEALVNPSVVAKTINAIPLGPVLGHIKETYLGDEPELLEGDQTRAVLEFLKLGPQLRALSEVVPTVRSEISAGLEEIDQARQPWDVALGATRATLSPVTGVVRPLIAKPIGAFVGELGGSQQSQETAELIAEIVGNMAVPGLGLPRITRGTLRRQ